MEPTLFLYRQPEVPLEAECITPQVFSALSQSGIEHLKVMHGNREAQLGDFFQVRGSGCETIRIEGDLSQVKLIGAGMSRGRIEIHGDVGMHLGVGISGGEILVHGNASDWVGSEMQGGRITVFGDAGHMVGSAYRGQIFGMAGGEIFIHGSAKNEVGGGMRRGLIAIGGSCGDFGGVNMGSGTIMVFGTPGIRWGAGMKRGSIVFLEQTEVLPSFSFAGVFNPVFLRFYLLHLRKFGFVVEDCHIRGKYGRWTGDGVVMNKGEILFYRA